MFFLPAHCLPGINEVECTVLLFIGTLLNFLIAADINIMGVLMESVDTYSSTRWYFNVRSSSLSLFIVRSAVSSSSLFVLSH